MAIRAKLIEKVEYQGRFLPIVEGTGKFKPNTIRREVSKGQRPEYDAYKEVPESATLEFQIHDRVGEDFLRLVNGIQGEQVVVHYLGGGGEIMPLAYTKSTGETTEGKIQVEIEAPTATQF